MHGPLNVKFKKAWTVFVKDELKCGMLKVSV